MGVLGRYCSDHGVLQLDAAPQRGSLPAELRRGDQPPFRLGPELARGERETGELGEPLPRDREFLGAFPVEVLVLDEDPDDPRAPGRIRFAGTDSHARSVVGRSDYARAVRPFGVGHPAFRFRRTSVCRLSSNEWGMDSSRLVGKDVA